MQDYHASIQPLLDACNARNRRGRVLLLVYAVTTVCFILSDTPMWRYLYGTALVVCAVAMVTLFIRTFIDLRKSNKLLKAWRVELDKRRSNVG